ncbi:hypothetical protein [Methylobacterium sp. CM6247]
MERLSYSDFKKLFLIEIALTSEGDTSKSFNPGKIASNIEGKFPNSWIKEAEQDLKLSQYCDGRTWLNGSTVSITGRGLEEVEDYLAQFGFGELNEEISKRDAEAQKSNEETSEHEENAYIIKIDRTDEKFKQIDAQVANIIKELKNNNSVMSEYGAIGSQRIAEIEAGRVLMQAEQVNINLLERVLVDSLKWFMQKIKDEGVKTIINQAILALLLHFSLKT